MREVILFSLMDNHVSFWEDTLCSLQRLNNIVSCIILVKSYSNMHIGFPKRNAIVITTTDYIAVLIILYHVDTASISSLGKFPTHEQ